MSDNRLTLRPEFDQVMALVVDGLNSEHSKRSYRKALQRFLSWWDAAGRQPITKALVQRYKVEELSRPGPDGKTPSPATVNLHLSAIRKLAQEAADNGLIEQALANGVSRVKGAPVRGVRAGNWLSKRQAEELLRPLGPGRAVLKDYRDRAMLALFVGTGLRVSEVAGLEFEQIQQRDGRWVVVDLAGKGRRVRTVPIPSWAKAAVDEWALQAGLESGKVFRAVRHYGHTLDPESVNVSPQAVYYAVKAAGRAAYKRTGEQVFLDIAPHDLRRSFAKLARKGGAELSQIQLTLGHSNVKTTQNYIGEEQNLTDAPCDRLGLDLSGD